MTAVQDKTLLLLNDNQSTVVHSTKAVCWSFDNRAVLTCAEKIIIINMVASSDLKTNKAEAFTTRIDETPDVSSLKTFSIASGLLNFKESFDNISEGERHGLSLDPSLTEDCIYPNPIRNTFKHAVCSPMCSTLDRPCNLIAAVTFGHRVVIFTETPEGWSLLLDCSPLIKHHTISGMKLPVTLGRSMPFDTYVDLVHSMCTVELEWSSVFSSSGSSEHSFLLLFTGAKNGTIAAWKMCLPFEAKNDFTVQCTDKYTSEVTAMSWHSRQQDQGLLAVGYFNGSVRVLSVCVNCDLPTSCIDVKETFADLLNDGLAISDLAWVQVDKTTTVLICCKQYYLSLYSVCGDTIMLVDHCHVDVSLPLTSISAFGSSGFTSSKDGDIIRFQLKHESGEISLDWSTVAITCMPFSSELPRFCLGVALSPDCGFCLSVHRVTHNAKILDLRKKFMSSQVIALSFPFKLTLESMLETLSGSSPHSPQEVMIHLRLHIQQKMQMNSSLQDILEIYAELNKRDDIQSLQVVRDMLLFLNDCSAPKIAYQKELKWVISAHEKITEKLIIRHIETCLQNVSSSPTLNELVIIKAMMSWMSTRNVTSNASNQNLASLDKVCQESASPLCAIPGLDKVCQESASPLCAIPGLDKVCQESASPLCAIPGLDKVCQESASPLCAIPGLDKVCQESASPLCAIPGLDKVCQESASPLCAICGSVQFNWFPVSKMCQRSSDKTVYAYTTSVSRHAREKV